MAPSVPSTPATSRIRAVPKAAPQLNGPAVRVTRLRAAKDASETPATTRKPSGLLAKGKEGLRKVSHKIDEKEGQIQKPKAIPPAVPEITSYSESLQVCSNVSKLNEARLTSDRPFYGYDHLQVMRICHHLGLVLILNFRVKGMFS